MLRMNESNHQYTIFNTQERLNGASRELDRLKKENYELRLGNEHLKVERSSEATA